MTNEQKNGPPEVAIHLPETKAAMAEESGTPNGLTTDPRKNGHGKNDGMNVTLRLLCLLTCVTAVSVMVTAKQASTISFYGFSIPVFSKWSFSDSFEYLVGVSAAVGLYSLLQLLVNSLRILRKSPVISSRNHAWLVFAADQIFAYAMMSAGSAASGVTNLNRTGIKHSSLPNFCKPLHIFCSRVAVSISFAFFSCFLLALSAVLDVVWLSKY